MMEEMLSHLVFSLHLAHLGLCDNISIDPNKPAPANLIMTEMQLESKAAAFMWLFLQCVSGNEWAHTIPHPRQCLQGQVF